MQNWLRAVAAARATGTDTWLEGGTAVRRVAGGANNALYQVWADDRCYAVKLCVADERRRAAREYGALRLLHVAGLDIAPEPLGLDESCAVLPFPVVVYRWLPGEPLGPSLTMQQLAALLESLHRMHALRQADFEDAGLPTAWFHWFDLEPYLTELHEFLAEYGSWLATTEPDGQDLRDRLARLVESCTEFITAAAVDPSRECFPLRLCHVDPNLANTVWGGGKAVQFSSGRMGRLSRTAVEQVVLDQKASQHRLFQAGAPSMRRELNNPGGRGRRLRWVDWEYSGWGDPALDAAEPRWHAALLGLSETQQAWLREHYRRPPDDPGFEERLEVWDRLLATRWPFLVLRELWSEHHGPDRLRLTQPAADPAELRVRLVHFIERAECFVRDSS